MVKTSLRLNNLQEIRQYVSATLYQIDLLKLDHFQISERLLVRNGKPCGLYFCLHGPRQVNHTAIWETDRNTILFYGCSGQRIGKTQLLDGPSLKLPETKQQAQQPVDDDQPPPVLANSPISKKQS